MDLNISILEQKEDDQLYQVVYEVENRMFQQIKIGSLIECIKAHLTIKNNNEIRQNSYKNTTKCWIYARYPIYNDCNDDKGLTNHDTSYEETCETNSCNVSNLHEENKSHIT